jgi:signal transduction histidine kinase
MNDARASLDPEVLSHRILTEQVALMCRLTTSPLLGSLLIGAIIAYLAVEDSGLQVSAGWYCASLIIMLIRWRVANAFLQRDRGHDAVRRCRSMMLALIVVFGAIWSIPTAFLLPTDPTKEIVMTVVFIGATATGIGSLSPVRHAYAALLIPFTLPYAISQFLLGGDHMLIALAALLYLPTMIVIANRQTDSVEGKIRLAIENEALADELRRERDRVAETNQQLQSQVEQQQRSVERIRLLNRDLELQASELRTANKDLEGFSYSVSHDLRAPLRAIDGFSRLLEESIPQHDPGPLKHSLSRIHENVVRMSKLIDDLLAFSHCGRQPVELNHLQMDELVRTAVNDARSAHTTQAPPVITIESLPRARGDQQLILQVWINLIDNAVKYSSKVAHPEIVIRGREEADRVVYEVSDNGIGFDSRYSNSLFGVFQRLHGAHEYPGTGVGLAIVQRIVSRHGGEVWAKSDNGHGATFGFALPKSAISDRQRVTSVA